MGTKDDIQKSSKIAKYFNPHGDHTLYMLNHTSTLPMIGLFNYGSKIEKNKCFALLKKNAHSYDSFIHICGIVAATRIAHY
jgi:hypothetical protein